MSSSNNTPSKKIRWYKSMINKIDRENRVAEKNKKREMLAGRKAEKPKKEEVKETKE